MSQGMLGKALSQWRRLGTLRFLRLIVYRLLYIYEISDWLEDRRLGIMTRTRLNPRDFGIQDPAAHVHIPTSYLEMREAMRHIRVVPGKDAFLDYGSGMGRIVIAAAMYPFRRVVGVEICPAFNDVAVRNVAIAKPRLACQDIDLVVGDAREFLVPHDTAVIFLYSPFEADVLRKVLQNIRRSLEESPRALSIIYVVPKALESDVGCPDWLVKRQDFVPLNRAGAIYDARLPHQ
jgi:SAM-dependent methyltransferase